MNDVTVPQQMALEIFKEAGKAPIHDAPYEIGYSRSDFFGNLKNLSVVARRALNAAFFNAASLPAELEPAGDTYDIDLDYFKWLAKFPSNNHDALKQALLEGLETSLQVTVLELDQNGEPIKDKHGNIKEKWAATQLLGPVAIAGGRISITIPKPIRFHIRDPRAYVHLSLRITSALTTAYAMVMYERLRRVAYRGETPWLTLDEFKDWFGKADSKNLSEFKNLKRYVLTPSQQQINELTDIYIDIETKAAGKGKKITHIRFIVKDNPDGKYVLKNVTEIAERNSETYNALRAEFGLTNNDFMEITKNSDDWTDDYIQRAIELARVRILESKVPVRHPGSLLMKFLREGIGMSDIERVQRERAQQEKLVKKEARIAEAAHRAERQSQKASDTERHLKAFLERTDEEKKAIFEEFQETSLWAANRATLLRRVPELTERNVTDDKVVSMTFVTFLKSREKNLMDSLL